MLRKKLWLAQQSVWRAKAGAAESLPLASGYLKAVLETDTALRGEIETKIFSFSGSDSTLAVINAMFLDEMPDMLGCSIVGWNFHLFGRVSDTYRQLNPQGWVVWGGTHAAHQAERIFRIYPSVDVIVNGEGELTFLELARAFVSGASKHELQNIDGISFKTPDGAIVTTKPQPRIMDLDSIPSPFLSGALPLTGSGGKFLYDYALMETNRGCPYACAFCYWGGAIGQKIRSFSIERLGEEIDLFARSGVEHIVLCDANFGMLRADAEFVELCARAKAKYGYPLHITTSWAKNKGRIFFEIVRRMKQIGFHSSFNLALQSLSEPVLEAMGRKNMKVNAWEDLAAWLQNEGMQMYGELIWGCPGETCESFLEGYDRLSRYVTHIATYPHLLLPNTTYVEKKAEYQIVSVRGDDHDFELVLSHNTMTFADNRKMHRFIFWARIFGEHLVLRHVWRPLRTLTGMTQSQGLLAFDAWIDGRDDKVLTRLAGLRGSVVEALEASSRLIEAGLECFYADPSIDAVMERWWEESILPQTPEASRAFLRDLFRYDWLTRPIYAAPGQERPLLPSIEANGGAYWVRKDVVFDYDIPAILRSFRQGETAMPAARKTALTFYYKTGFCNEMSLYHNAHNQAFFATTELPGAGSPNTSIDAPAFMQAAEESPSVLVQIN
jgi:tRNA A37 methylthiotransferase MiaB